VQGTPFGRYRLIELLGRGGMGEVWRAHDTAINNRTVAIKLLKLHLASDSAFVQRFRREADAAARLNNPHIIPIHTYGEIDGRLYVDMRLIEGRDLQQVLAEGPLEPARAVRIIEQVAKALHAAHKIGLVHRDVKPSNILLDEDDFAYLIDFGIARAADETRLTGTGLIIGSWHYMSPERFRAGQVDARSDIYALACVLYECLIGCRPYPGDNLEQQIAAHLTEPPPRPSSTGPNIPKYLDAVIATGMAKDPDQRYATTVELADAAHDAITVPLASHSQSAPPDDQTRTAVAPLLANEPVQQQTADWTLTATQPADQISGTTDDGLVFAKVVYTADDLAALLGEKPVNWRWAVFASVLAQRRAVLLPRLRVEALGFAVPTGLQARSGYEVVGFVANYLDALRQLVGDLEAFMLTPAFIAVFGDRGDESTADGEGLVDTANRLMDYHQRCLELAESCRGLSVHRDYVPLLQDCARLTTNLLGGYRRFIDEFVELVGDLPDVQRAGRGIAVERTVALGMEDADQFWELFNRITKQVQALIAIADSHPSSP
jgi:predicted Ser/Thr protein kinase